MEQVTLRIQFPEGGGHFRADIIRTVRFMTGLGLKEAHDVVISQDARITVNNDFNLDGRIADLRTWHCIVENVKHSLRRYNIDSKGLPFQDHQGVFVDYRDYAVLETELNALKRKLAQLAA